MSVWKRKRQNNNRSWWGPRRSAWDQSNRCKQVGCQQSQAERTSFLAWVWCRKYCALVCIDVLQACTWFRIHIYAVLIRDKNRHPPKQTPKQTTTTTKTPEKQQQNKQKTTTWYILHRVWMALFLVFYYAIVTLFTVAGQLWVIILRYNYE